MLSEFSTYAKAPSPFEGAFVSWTLVRAARNVRHNKPPAMRVDNTKCYAPRPLPSSMVIVQVASPEGKVMVMAQKANSLAHTKWLCKYHIVFAPKYRRKVVYNQYRKDLGEIFRQLCQWKGVEIIEGHLMPDHVHMLVSIPPKISVSSFMGYLKGKSSLLMFDRHANLKYKFGNRKFWAEGYYVSTVGLNEATIAKYIREQESADIAQDRLSVKEYEDPFERGPQHR